MTFEWIQHSWLSTAISSSTWGYPIIAGLHVLGIALFGGAVLVENLERAGLFMPRLTPDEQRWPSLRWTGLAVMALTGVLLFVSEPVKCYDSWSFRAKMLLLAMLGFNSFASRRRRRLGACFSLLLWTAVIFAGRGIAFF